MLAPEGGWLTGPAHLTSNVELHVAVSAEECPPTRLSASHRRRRQFRK